MSEGCRSWTDNRNIIPTRDAVTALWNSVLRPCRDLPVSRFVCLWTRHHVCFSTALTRASAGSSVKRERKQFSCMGRSVPDFFSPTEHCCQIGINWLLLHKCINAHLSITVKQGALPFSIPLEELSISCRRHIFIDHLVGVVVNTALTTFTSHDRSWVPL